LKGLTAFAVGLFYYQETQFLSRKPVCQTINQVAAFLQRLRCKAAKEVRNGLKLLNETLAVILPDHLGQFLIVVDEV
jgi:exosortase/archaeosortase